MGEEINKAYLERLRKRAEILYSNNFRIYGLGNFDLEIDDVAALLAAMDGGLEEFNKQAGKLYEELEKQRMG